MEISSLRYLLFLNTIRCILIFLLLTIYKKKMSFNFLGATAFGRAHFGAGTGNIFLNSVRCRGIETKLEHCDKATTNNTCSHNEDAGVRCASKWFLKSEVNYIYMKGRIFHCSIRLWILILAQRR